MPGRDYTMPLFRLGISKTQFSNRVYQRLPGVDGFNQRMLAQPGYFIDSKGFKTFR